MSYATTAKRPHPLAAVGAMGVPATFGIVLIAGLAVKHVIVPPIPNPDATNVPPVVVTPTVVETDLPPTDAKTSAPDTPSPTYTGPIITPDVNLGETGPLTDLGGDDIGSLFGGDGFVGSLPPIEPLLDPVAASPRGNPANWITTADYRSNWIRRELTGTARFTLQIDTAGKVSGCDITGSTGHAALDQATCRLIEARAVFNPAKGTDGKIVAGTYASSVNWTIPE